MTSASLNFEFNACDVATIDRMIHLFYYIRDDQMKRFGSDLVSGVGMS